MSSPSSNATAPQQGPLADLLQQNGICAAVFADQFGFKLEAYDGIKKQNGALKELTAQRDEFVQKFNDSIKERIRS